MKWRQGRRSENVEDRRSAGPISGKAGAAGVGGIGLIVLVLLVTLMGGDPSAVLEEGGLLQEGVAPPGQEQAPRSPEEEALADFVSVVLADTEDVWNMLFPEALGGAYEEPRLVLFSGRVSSACGLADAAVGPFYCPGDRQVYIDLSFYHDLQERFGAPGDFAQAYVIAHEVGHHVQNLMGITGQVERIRRQASQVEGNRVSTRLELQADCLAGIWAHHAQKARQILESGDIEEGLNAAAAIGDDRLQMQAQGYVVPDAFTHGSSAQRVTWFKRGLETGDVDACNTFDSDE